MRTRCKSDRELPPPNIYIWVLLAALEAVCAWMLASAVCSVTASSVMLLRTFTFCTTALISQIVFKRELNRWGMAGCIITGLGCTIAGYNAVHVTVAPSSTSGPTPEQIYDHHDRFISVLIVFFSCLLTSVRLCADESFLATQAISPLKAAGIGHTVALLILVGIGVFGGGLQEIQTVSQLLWSEVPLRNYAILMCVAAAMISVAIPIIAKLSTGLLRSMLHSVRTLIVIFVELQLGWIMLSPWRWIVVIAVLSGQLLYVYSLSMQGFRGIFSDDMRMSEEAKINVLPVEHEESGVALLVAPLMD